MNDPAGFEGPGPREVFRKFLGVDAGIDDPLALLGLAAENVSEAAVIAALQRQLTRIAASPDALTPEADEVRLALHAAAARLLDPTSRAQAMKNTPGGAAPAAGNPGEMPVEAAMLLTMGTNGGWNKRSMHRMALVARSYGLAPEQTVSTIRELMSHPAAPPQPLQKPSPGPRALRSAPVAWAPVGAADPATAGAPVGAAAGVGPSNLGTPEPGLSWPDHGDPGRGAVKAVVLFGSAGLIGVTAIVVLCIALLTGKKAAAPAPATPGTPVATNPSTPEEHELFPTQPKEASRKAQPIGATPQRIGDWNDLLRGMADAGAGVDVDVSAAADRFDEVFAKMAATWGEATPDGVVAGVDRIVEFLYRAAPHADVAVRVIETVAAPAAALKPGGDLTAAQVSSAAWSAGVLARVSRERDLPASIRNRVQAALAAAFPGSSGPGETTFRSGALAALAAMPERLAKPAGKPEAKEVDKAWRNWLAALSALDGKQSVLFTRTTLVALDFLLTEAPEPTQDRTVFDAIGLLTTSLPWRKDDESRRWLLRWFDSPAVTSADLYALTAALATQSGAEGVDSSMVLSGGAGESQRADLRDRYATVWGLTAGRTRDALVQDWANAAKQGLGPSQDESENSPVDALARAVNLARLNQAAGLLWSGDTGSVPGLLEPYNRPTPAVNPNAPVTYQFQTRITLLTFGGGDMPTDWLVKYCSARSPATRVQLLSQMNRIPSPAEADVIVEDACRGSNPQLRNDARAIVINYKDSGSIINAMLEFAPMVPITTDNADLIEKVTYTTLPGTKDPTWRVAVRRALVERLSEVLAGEGELAKVGDLSDALTAAYAPAAAKPPQNDSDAQPPPLAVGRREAAATPIEAEAMSLRGRWQREAESLVASGREPLSLSQMESRRSARVRLEVGRIQRFVGEQANMCELMAFVITAEQPGRADDVAKVVEELTESRRNAKHIFDQIECGERARLRLWMIRFGEGSA